MIRAFSAALEDENLLVRRSALDLLLQAMRVDSVAVRKAHADDQGILMRSATGIVLRRDLSLNRRLYNWLLGPEEKVEHQAAYLKKNALELLSTTLRASVDPRPATTSINVHITRTKCLAHQESTPKIGRSRYSFRCWTSGRLVLL